MDPDHLTEEDMKELMDITQLSEKDFDFDFTKNAVTLSDELVLAYEHELDDVVKKYLAAGVSPTKGTHDHNMLKLVIDNDDCATVSMLVEYDYITLDCGFDEFVEMSHKFGAGRMTYILLGYLNKHDHL